MMDIDPACEGRSDCFHIAQGGGFTHSGLGEVCLHEICVIPYVGSLKIGETINPCVIRDHGSISGDVRTYVGHFPNSVRGYQTTHGRNPCG